MCFIYMCLLSTDYAVMNTEQVVKKRYLYL
jgi:hypothetical protein